MANDNETLEQVCEIVADLCSPDGGSFETVNGDRVYATLLADRILDAHKREIAAKDAENARLVSVINSECNKCGDCAKFGYDCNAGDIDGNENCRACKKFVSKEVSALRALVGELADALLAACDDTCDYCKKHLNISEASALLCFYGGQCNVGQAYGRLVSKAREAVK